MRLRDALGLKRIWDISVVVGEMGRMSLFIESVFFMPT